MDVTWVFQSGYFDITFMSVCTLIYFITSNWKLFYYKNFPHGIWDKCNVFYNLQMSNFFDPLIFAYIF